MSTGGVGFLTLLQVEPERRLAYLMILPGSRMQFYDLWNEGLWAEGTKDTTPLAFIREGLSRGTLRLQRIVRSPADHLRVRVYDTTAIMLTPIGDEVVEINGHKMPRTLEIIDLGYDNDNLLVSRVSGLRLNTAKTTVVLPTPSPQTIGPSVFLAHASKAYDTVQCLGAFYRRDEAVQRCRERPNADEDGQWPYDAWWVEEWVVGGNYKATWDVLSDGEIKLRTE
jgi:hypothetical protein